MKNPFESRAEELDSGYYFDNKVRVICFLHRDSNSEYFMKPKIYSRFQNENTLPWDRCSIVNNLIELDYIKYSKEAENWREDFKWIINSSIEEHFLQFLESTGNYEFIILFNRVKIQLK